MEPLFKPHATGYVIQRQILHSHVHCIVAVCHYRCTCNVFLFRTSCLSTSNNYNLITPTQRESLPRTAHFPSLPWLQCRRDGVEACAMIVHALDRWNFLCNYLQSQSIGMNPLHVMVPCTLSASFAFMLPVATPPNAIVFSYGYLKVADMVSAAEVCWGYYGNYIDNV